MTRPNFHLGHLVGGVGGRPIGRKLPNFQGTAAISATFFGFWGWRGGREASLLMWRQLSARFLSQVGHATARNDLSLVILTPPLPCTTASTPPVEENRGNGRHHHPSPASPKPPRNYETYINLVKKRLNLTTQSRGKWEPRRGIKNTKKKLRTTSLPVYLDCNLWLWNPILENKGHCPISILSILSTLGYSGRL